MMNSVGTPGASQVVSHSVGAERVVRPSASGGGEMASNLISVNLGTDSGEQTLRVLPQESSHADVSLRLRGDSRASFHLRAFQRPSADLQQRIPEAVPSPYGHNLDITALLPIWLEALDGRKEDWIFGLGKMLIASGYDQSLDDIIVDLRMLERLQSALLKNLRLVPEDRREKALEYICSDVTKTGLTVFRHYSRTTLLEHFPESERERIGRMLELAGVKFTED